LPKERKDKMKKHNKQGRSNKISPQICVTAAECGDNPEKMIRKFTRKVKNEGIMDEMRNRRHYIKPSALKTEEKRRVRKMIEKENKRNLELINTSSSPRRGPNYRSRK
jgi:ribosomal protein S21